MNSENLIAKIASEDWEFEEIHKLNYKTFVEEIPQHAPNPGKKLVDQFHTENTYLIVLKEKELVGMGALRDQRPFSLDYKIENIDQFLPPFNKICEARLLAIRPGHRAGIVFGLLFKEWAKYWKDKDYDLSVMSGVIHQLKLYKSMGWIPFGSLVGKDGSQFQPMYLTKKALYKLFDESNILTQNSNTSNGKVKNYVNLLPGPVNIHPQVKEIFGEMPVYHRLESFTQDYENTKKLLRELVNAKYVQILMGSGTLGNDTVAAQLSRTGEHGLILSNGEFGKRLIDHGHRHQLSFDTLENEWGSIINREQISTTLDNNPDIKWVWFVHCETSTGVLNDLEFLKKISAKRGLKLCADCMSSIGTLPINLEGVYLATCVSSKGLAALAGLSLIFHNHEIEPSPNHIPRYLDLGIYATTRGTPFTMSSNALYALRDSIKRRRYGKYFKQISDLSDWMRTELQKMGFEILAPKEHSSPAILTIILPKEINSKKLGENLVQAGYLTSYGSYYLIERNLLQVILMGECSQETIKPFFEEFKKQIEILKVSY